MTQNKKQKTDPPPPFVSSHIPSKSNIANDITTNVVSGFTFGAGNSIAKNTIDNIFQQKPEIITDPKPEPKQESSLHEEYFECLKHNKDEICKTFYLEK